MKLLLDQNLSFKLVSALADVFPGAHVRDVSLTQSDDHANWAYANKNGFMVVPQDADFAEMAALHALRQRLCGFAVETSSDRQLVAYARRSDCTV
jgi:predicted nuclease of predicted toxin-antitoxin system